MKVGFQDLLECNLPLPGVAACGVRLADGSCESRCYGDWLAAAQVEQLLNRLALAAESLGRHCLQPTRLCWVFEHSRVHLALRKDGACLALFVENRPGAAGPKLQALLDEFARQTGG